MTKDTMAVLALLEKSADADFLRDMIGFAAQRLMDLEVGGLTGAAYGEKSAERPCRVDGNPPGNLRVWRGQSPPPSAAKACDAVPDGNEKLAPTASQDRPALRLVAGRILM